MSLKIYILLLLSSLFTVPKAFADEKFLRLKGGLIDEITKEPVSGFTIKQVEDEGDSTIVNFDKSTFDLWIPANHITKIYFIKDGYVMNHMMVDASVIPSKAYEKKQKIDDLTVKMNKADGGTYSMDKPVLVAEYMPKANAFEVKDMTLKKNQKIPGDYEPPFPSPADTYINVKPTNNRLETTKSFNETKAKGNAGIARILQGVIFADMNYCLFNERTNDANLYLANLISSDEDTWGNIKEFDSPEYGRIVTRTVNREQSIDTLFALGAYLETSRLAFQSFTSDSKVLVHLKVLKRVLNGFLPSAPSPQVQDFMKGMYGLMPDIDQLEQDYKDKLKNKLNFEMQEDAAFISIREKIDKIYQTVIE